MSQMLLLLAGFSILAAGSPRNLYNEGVSKLKAGEIEDAISGFESAAVSAKGPLRAAALFNLGLAHAVKGDAISQAKPKDAKEPESRDAKVRRLAAAAESYRRALALFRRVPSPAADADRGAKAVKVRLLAVLDKIQKLAEEAKKEAEEQALKNPPLLLLKTLSGERDRRRAADRLIDLPRRRRHIPARRLRQAEYAARSLMEKLAVVLEAPPAMAAPAGQPSPAPAGVVPEAAKAAADAVRRGATAMGEAEGHLDGRDAKGTVEVQGRAIAELGAAARRLPIVLPPLVDKLLGDQQSLLSLSSAGDWRLGATEETEIRSWLAHLTTLPDPAPQAGTKALSAETIGRIRTLAGDAEAACARAGGHLAAGRVQESVPEQEFVVEKLQAIRELLPRPPVPPAERIRKLIKEEREVEGAIGALPGMSPDARAEESRGLGERQTGNGREAGSIGKELESSPPEREKRAAAKVREAETEVHASAESLRRDLPDPAGASVQRAIASLEEALQILSGKKNEDQQQKQKQNQKDQSGDQGQKDQPKPERKSEDARKLDSREARRLMEEMDKKRREEEKKLFRGLGGPKVEKDW